MQKTAERKVPNVPKCMIAKKEVLACEKGFAKVQHCAPGNRVSDAMLPNVPMLWTSGGGLMRPCELFDPVDDCVALIFQTADADRTPHKTFGDGSLAVLRTPAITVPENVSYWSGIQARLLQWATSASCCSGRATYAKH